ncbi:maleylacetoacetate isomerase [Aliiglaciecola sp. CAU 1673]|uniref:maleylacetoacetate isomerase n=1 Tax=Aliiglaciecola sp. CAU 1673 TaxID=3032595 RepID=UPI0023DC8CC4|nr:maleylacetoacetate isomerase [Aliiglaciecola sp. CAU 1673]MDF2179574.1 maleylacetoacetate isomerase [Aliiglaciecola sp. CAU 1673]
MSIKLYGYWRSSASYRARIALNLKQVDYEYVPVHLVKNGGEQHMEAYRSLNPAELLPTLVDEDEDIILTQSLAIIEYLDERFDTGIQLLPEHKLQRARVRAVAYDLAADIQPLGNLRVLQYLEANFGADAQTKAAWARHWIEKGFGAIEKRIQNTAGQYCFGFDVSLADVCLVPQVYNAKRFNVDMEAYPLISRIADNCNKLEAFIQAQPENQPDAE